MTERFGPWELGRRIALGNFADVSEASRDGGETVLALKRLHAHTAREPEMHALFSRECAIATSLPAHPGLVAGLEVGEVDGRPWLTMPLVMGADLRRRIDAGAAPSAGRARSIVRELCAALDQLHEAGWIHGDVNPSNVLVEPVQGDVGASGVGPLHAVLCDYGVARRPGEPGPVRGTHAYMAPEQVRGEPWSPATDVFALGVMLWELASGARLYYRGASYLTMAAVMEEEAPALDDAPLDAIVRRAIAKDAAARYPTPRALEQALVERS